MCGVSTGCSGRASLRAGWGGCPHMNLSADYSAHPIQKLVPRAGQWQEPRLAVVQAKRRTGKRDAGEWVFWLVSTHTISGHEFSDLPALIRGHGDAMSGVAEGVVHAVKLSGVRHDVEGKVERASPDVVNFGVGELRIHADHAVTENCGAAADGLIVLREKRSAPAKQHAPVGGEAVIVEIVLGVVDHAVARAELLRQLLRQDFRGDNERTDRDDSLLQCGRGRAGVSAGGDENFVCPERAAGGCDLPARFSLARVALDGLDAGVLENLRPG